MILVDTSIWSLALRRRAAALSAEEERVVGEWARLVAEGMAALIGPIRQEILSGIRRIEAFRALRRTLLDFPHLNIAAEDYDRAAEFFKVCRAGGVTGGPIDMLISSVAYRHAIPVFAVDTDYVMYARHLPLRLHLPRPSR
jgi:predicted nucleic acid-binding protein